MNDQNSQSAPEKKSAHSRKVKIAFLVVLLVAVGIIYMIQRRGLSMRGWGDNLNTALQQAGADKRPVLVFFVNRPPSVTANTIKAHINQPANRKALEAGKYITVIVELSSLKSDPARKYKIKQLPTLMVLRPDGTERNRHEGNIGEIPFRQQFLNVKNAKQP